MDEKSKINMISFKIDETNRKIDNNFNQDHIIYRNIKIIKGLMNN